MQGQRQNPSHNNTELDRMPGCTNDSIEFGACVGSKVNRSRQAGDLNHGSNVNPSEVLQKAERGDHAGEPDHPGEQSLQLLPGAQALGSQ